VLDNGLSRAYAPETYQQKCAAVFEPVYESYPEQNVGVYTQLKISLSKASIHFGAALLDFLEPPNCETIAPHRFGLSQRKGYGKILVAASRALNYRL